ncbi:MAG TPA: TrbI/VirB10 family protein [Vicinamibacterales bacterium]|nr:TrbI/VirB10 family protein [Vicinamibacterales bacterium]
MPYGGPAGYSAYPAADSALSAERQKRAYESLFASNIALSYRSVGRPTEQPKTSLLSVGGSPAVPSRSDDSTARLAAPQASRPSPMDVAAQETSSEQVDHAPEKPRHQFSTELNWADGKAYRVFEGSVIETVLTNRLDGTFSGPVNCMVTTPVHSHDGRKVLIPRGSRVLGEVRKVDAWGQQRLAVVFHRLIMPDGYSLDLDRFQGLNQVGETGLVDQINRHYLQIFGVSLAIGAIAGLSQANTRYGPETTAADVYRQGVADSLSQSSLRILDRYLNVLPTFTIREGHRLKVAITQDLSLPAYNQHRLPSDL